MKRVKWILAAVMVLLGAIFKRRRAQGWMD